jgi:hypothetical protein
MSLEFSNTTPKILIYTSSDMGEQLKDYLMDKVAILDHILEDAPHEGELGQIDFFKGSVEEHGKYCIFFNLGEKHQIEYLTISDELAERTFYIDVEGIIDTEVLGITNAECIIDNTVEELWERCLIDAVETRVADDS